eukprot:m.91665 g.91665  ORF g.91665 m.91665 type:complete len:232 (-) comp8878_c0_seq2:597-1292(-)
MLAYTKEYYNTYVGTFRDPRRRILSAFNYHRHAYGLGQRFQEELKEKHTLKDFVTFPGISSCQVKQLTGRQCATPVTISILDLWRAVRRVKKFFAFIGVTEYYTTSVCLFHRMFGGKISAVEFENLRPTGDVIERVEAEGYTTLPKDAWKGLSVNYEKYDWLLYVVVLDMFYNNVKLYGLEIPAKLEEERRKVGKYCDEWIGFVDKTMMVTAQLPEYQPTQQCLSYLEENG